MSFVITSVIVSILLIAVWTDYALGALRSYRQTKTRGVMREYVVAIAMLVIALGLAVAILALRLPAGEPVDRLASGAVSTLRATMLSVGVWLAWDRRKRPA